MRFVVTLAACLALFGPVASAEGLYRWVTEDGRVEIGTTPPPGTAAVPWLPDPADAAQPAEPAAPVTPATHVPTAANGDCARRSEAARKTAAKIAKLESEIDRLERKLESLESNEVAWSRTSCVSQGIDGPKSDCVTSHFDRDVEVDRAEQALDRARDNLDDLELRARGATTAAECAPAAAD